MHAVTYLLLYTVVMACIQQCWHQCWSIGCGRGNNNHVGHAAGVVYSITLTFKYQFFISYLV